MMMQRLLFPFEFCFLFARFLSLAAIPSFRLLAAILIPKLQVFVSAS